MLKSVMINHIHLKFAHVLVKEPTTINSTQIYRCNLQVVILSYQVAKFFDHPSGGSQAMKDLLQNYVILLLLIFFDSSFNV